jgi:hypothetical protein
MWAAGESLAASADLKGFADSVLLQTTQTIGHLGLFRDSRLAHLLRMAF